jgi:phosphate transport system substrate-binding protein
MLCLAEGSDKIIPSGDARAGDAFEILADYYSNKFPNISFSPLINSGSGNGFLELARGECNIALADRPPRKKELIRFSESGVEPVTHLIAFESLAIVVNPSNSVDNLSFEQLRSIWTGTTTNWAQLGGPDQEILVGFRYDGYGLGADDVFQDLVSLGHYSYPSNKEVVHTDRICEFIKMHPNGISWTTPSLVTTNAKAIRIDGVKPTRETIAHHQYRLSRPLFAITNGFPSPGSPLADFLGFVRSPEGQQVVSSHNTGSTKLDPIVIFTEIETSNQKLDPTVKTPIESGNEQGTAGQL